MSPLSFMLLLPGEHRIVKSLHLGLDLEVAYTSPEQRPFSMARLPSFFEVRQQEMHTVVGVLLAASIPPDQRSDRKASYCSGHCNCSPVIVVAAACCAQYTCDCRLCTLNIPTMASWMP